MLCVSSGLINGQHPAIGTGMDCSCPEACHIIPEFQQQLINLRSAGGGTLVLFIESAESTHIFLTHDGGVL